MSPVPPPSAGGADGPAPAPGPASGGTEGPADEHGTVLRPWPRRPKRLATAVVEDLIDRIVGGDLPEGGPLPIEPVLCELFGVSRTVIREAVKSLEAMRLVTAQQGQGTRIRRSDEWDLLNPVVLAASVRHDAELAILEDMVATRRALEAQMASRAAARSAPEDLQRITAAFELLVAEENDPARYLRADLEFHDAVMVASGNRLGRAVVRTINAEAYRSLRYIGDTSVKDCQDSTAEHRLIHDRVRAGDSEGAARAMDDHIQRSWLHRRPPRPERPERPER
ncbi:FadR/GntR family transcriptional regulator [Streptomyces sp. NBC_00448]|uniref:FadR/GntR family transcriptional regulator n=1 Tax=Streptomyces sp. NBC_00448 TaxID=2903652 RepID=UPI002E1D7C02